MKIGAYSPKTGQSLADDITGINFGNVQKGCHSVLPVLIRPEKEDEDISGLELYLQNAGGFDFTEYGYFTHSGFVPVKSYDSSVPIETGYYYISDHFTENPSPIEGATGGVDIDIHGDGYGDYVWLDVQPGLMETGGTSTINYRFIFEYS
jgi:hypothetical protein